MVKKRKSDATRLDEVDRSMYSTFCSAASSLSQLYTQTMHQQRLSFHAGERHALEKLYNWILRQQQDGVRVMTGDILAYVQEIMKLEDFVQGHQNELDYGTEEPPLSPRPILQQQPSQTSPIHPAHHGLLVSSNAHGAATVGQCFRPGISDQNKNNVFSNALSSPAHRSLQQYHLTHGGHNANSAITRNNEFGGNQSRDPNPQSSNSSMDMHADSPGHDSPY